MSNEQSIIRLLQKVQAAPEEALVAYSHLYEDVYPGDRPEETWHDLEKEEGPQLRAAVKLGYVTSTFRGWEPEFPEEHVLDGGDYIVTLTGKGVEYLIAIEKQQHGIEWTKLFDPLGALAKYVLLPAAGIVIAAIILSILGLPK